MGQWYVIRGKVKKGPFSLAQLKSAATKGTLLATDMVQLEGSGQWKKAGEVRDIFAGPPVPPAPVRPSTAPPPKAHPPTMPKRVLPEATPEMPPVLPSKGKITGWLRAGKAGGVGLVVLVPTLILLSRPGAQVDVPENPPVEQIAQTNLKDQAKVVPDGVKNEKKDDPKDEIRSEATATSSPAEAVLVGSVWHGQESLTTAQPMTFEYDSVLTVVKREGDDFGAIVTARAFGDQPIKLKALSISDGVAELDVEGATVYFPQCDVFSFDEGLFKKLCRSFADGDMAALRRLWSEAT